MTDRSAKDSRDAPPTHRVGRDDGDLGPTTPLQGRVRAAMRAQAEQVQPRPELRHRINERIERADRRARLQVSLVTAVIVLVGGGLVATSVLDTDEARIAAPRQSDVVAAVELPSTTPESPAGGTVDASEDDVSTDGGQVQQLRLAPGDTVSVGGTLTKGQVQTFEVTAEAGSFRFQVTEGIREITVVGTLDGRPVDAEGQDGTSVAVELGPGQETVSVMVFGGGLDLRPYAWQGTVSLAVD